MVTRARKSSKPSETAKNKKPRGSWGGSGRGRRDCILFWTRRVRVTPPTKGDNRLKANWSVTFKITNNCDQKPITPNGFLLRLNLSRAISPRFRGTLINRTCVCLRERKYTTQKKVVRKGRGRKPNLEVESSDFCRICKVNFKKNGTYISSENLFITDTDLQIQNCKNEV